MNACTNAIKENVDRNDHKMFGMKLILQNSSETSVVYPVLLFIINSKMTRQPVLSSPVNTYVTMFGVVNLYL